MKRYAWIGIIAALTLIAIGVGTWLYIGQAGTSRLEQWIGAQVTGILESHIEPQVSFENLDYQAPRTVVVENLRITAEGHTFVNVQRLLLELAEVPRRGKPIKIARIICETPHLQFLDTPSGGFVGWNDFIRQEAVEDPEAVPQEFRLSEVIQLRYVEIRDGQLLYKALDEASEPMILPGISMTLETPPVSDEPDWHVLTGVLQRDPIFNLTIDGRINLDEAILELDQLTLNATLNEEQYQTVPPSLQQFLREYQVRGELAAAIQGRIPFNHLDRITGEVQATVTDAGVTFGETTPTIGRVEVQAKLPDGKMHLTINDVAMTSRERSVLSIASIAVTASGLPTAGEPVRIEQFEINQPKVALIAARDEGFMGWSTLAEVAEDDDRDELESPSEAQPATAPATQPGLEQAMQYVVLEQFNINQAAFSYEPDGDQPPLTLAGIDLALRTHLRPEQQEILELEGEILREPILNGQVKASLNSRNSVLQVDDLQLEVYVSPDTYSALPEQTQDFLKQHQARGRLNVSGQGELPLTQMAETRGELRAVLEDLFFTYQGLSVPIQQVELMAAAPDGGVTCSILSATLQQDDLTLFSLDAGQLQIDEIPLGDGPVIISRLALDKPRFQFIETQDGGLTGWDRLSSEQPDTRPAENDAGREAIEEFWTNRFLLRQFEVQNAGVTYQPRGMDEPIQLEEIAITASSDRLAEPGWLQISGDVRRPPVLGLNFQGQIKLEEALAQIRDAQFRVDIDQEALETLSGGIQDTLTNYAVSGRISGDFTGTVPFQELEKSSGSLNLQVDRSRFLINQVVWPIESLGLTAELPDGPIQMQARNVTAEYEGETIASLSEGQLELANLPGGSEPLHVRELQLTDPMVHLIERDDRWLGFERLMPSDPMAEQPAEPSQPLTRQLILDRLDVRNGQLLLASEGGGNPLYLSGLDARLQSSISDQDGWYQVDGQATIDPILTLNIQGRLQPQEALFDATELSLHANFDAEEFDTLPDEVRRVIEQNALDGDIDAGFEGRIDLQNVLRTEGQLAVTMDAANIRIIGIEFPVGRLKLQARLPDGQLDLTGSDIRLISQDVTILGMQQFDLQVPQISARPLEFEKIHLIQPHVTLVEDEHGGFVGWNNLISEEERARHAGPVDEPAMQPPNARASGEPESTPPRPPAAETDESGPDWPNMFILREVKIDNGNLVYQLLDESEPMTLPGINADLRMPPLENQPDWYALTGSVKRLPLFTTRLDGRINVKEQLIDVNQFTLQTDLQPAQYSELPPQLQKYLQQHEVQGQMNVQFKGRIAIQEPEKSQGRLQAIIRNARFVQDEIVWPAELIELQTDMQNGVAALNLNARLLSGQVEATGNITLAEPQPMQAQWTIDQINMEETLRLAQGGEPKYAGTIQSNGRITGELANLPQTLDGSGSLQITEGKLINLPVISEIVTLVTSAMLIRAPRHRDSASFQFQLGPEKVHISTMDIKTSLVGIDGKGDVYYEEGQLDMNVRAVPLKQIEDAVGKVLGRIGDLIKDVGGQVVSYDVTGTISEPKVSVRALGIGR